MKSESPIRATVGAVPDRNSKADAAPTSKRPRGQSTLANVLTAFRGQKHRSSISKEDIGRPVLDEKNIPFKSQSPLVPLGEVSPSTPHFYTPPPGPQLSNPVVPNSPDKRSFLVRSSSAPVQNIDSCYFPPPETYNFSNCLSDPKHSHAYPDLVRARQPRPGYGDRPFLQRKLELFIPPNPSRRPPPSPISTLAHVKRLDRGFEDALVEHDQQKPQAFSVPLKLSRLENAAKTLSSILEASQETEKGRIQKSTQKLVTVMNSIRSSLQPPANVGTKVRAIQEAKETQLLVAERAKRSGDEPPPYDFFELIGKGAYGRVFKGKNRATGELVAIKIIDTDKTDYEEMTTKNLQETLREINILQQLKDSRARPYVNIIEEARTVHNELWIISEYASGGSVNTLMKPRLQLARSGLEEKFLIPIARELALGLKFVHEAGVIHRDIKSNNILVNEDGRVQLCDFGVSGALEPEIAKRSTIVGTPNWMAPELKKEWVKDVDPSRMAAPNEILYGSEIDIWAYGCTIYEIATGFPPFHLTKQIMLPEAGVPQLEGDQFSDELKSLISFVLQPNPRDRPTADRILEHPYLVDSTKLYPTVSLVALVEQYYRWEHAGGSRVSLFNPFGAQAPDPLAPEADDDDEDWTFSTTDEFERHFASELSDPFTDTSSGQGFSGMNEPQDEDRFAKLQASIRAEQADRGKRRLDRLFDTNSTPYRLSMMDPDSERFSSDLVLRDFNPGAPNRETVIDLDFAAPTVADIPSIDLGEVPTVKANRLNRLMRDLDMEEEEERDDFDIDQTARRATREWTFPEMPEQSNRRTVDWKFPAVPAVSDKTNRQTLELTAVPDKANRRTMEWTFDASMAESTHDPLPRASRISRRRDTQELTVPPANEPLQENRRTQEFVFPVKDPAEDGDLMDQDFSFSSSSSPTLGPGFRPGLRHAATVPFDSFDDYPRISSSPESPLRSSIIDLDMANIDDFRSPTSGSASTSTYTAGLEQMNGNPFDLEDQVHLSQSNNRASFHMKSQSEPNHAIPGLLTPQTYDEQGYPTTQDPHHPSMHARGVSSASQVQAKPPPNNAGNLRQRSSHQSQSHWDGWSHEHAFRTDESSPSSISPATSGEEEDTINDRWDKLEKQASQSQRRQMSVFRSRRTASQDEDPRSDAEDHYASESYDDLPARHSRVSVGPNGRPLVDFPIPRGPDPEALLGVDTDPAVLSNALWKSTLELRDGLRTSRDLLKSMRLAEMRPVAEDEEEN